MDGAGIFARHIQDHNEANTTLVKYWGYAERVLPCTKDAGTCEYLDAVYWMHDVSMLYTFILWGVILGILVLWCMLRFRRMGVESQGRGGLVDDLCGFAERQKRKWLLSDAPWRGVFGRVSRVQVFVLVVLLGYLAVFSLVGIVYKTWITPISGSNLYNTRTGLGGWSDRIGALAYALTPLAILLCQRESVLSLITGIPYQHFNFLHRWLGRIIFVQSFLHTLGWTLVEGKFYQPQPSVYATFMAQQYVVFGVVAMFFITWLTLFSTEWAIRLTGYEFFKITHWIIAVLYIGACWGHWDKLYCWMVPSLALIVIDQSIRLARTAYIHHRPSGNGTSRGVLGFTSLNATSTVLTDENGTVIRLDLDHQPSSISWQAGQHFFLTFPSLSIWQSHPFTVSSLPENSHTYIIRARTGLTTRLAALGNTPTLPIILSGPYGNSYPSYDSQHLLAIAGGTGVSFTLPILQAATQQFRNREAILHFVWIIKRSADMTWLTSELHELLQNSLTEFLGMRISIFITREQRDEKELPSSSSNSSSNFPFSAGEKDKSAATASVSPISSSITVADLLRFKHPRFQVSFLQDHHPSVAEIVTDFRQKTFSFGSGGVEIVGSGPEAMGSDLRAAVAGIEEEADGIRCYWDSR